MKILAIETSCDETAVCLIQAQGDLSDPHFQVLGNNLLSQIDIHKPYGGVFPSLAKREHAKNLVPLLIDTLNQAGQLIPRPTKLQPPASQEDRLRELFSREPVLSDSFLDFIANYQPPPDLDALAVTIGPGLEPALWTGTNLAQALRLTWQLPVIPVNHMAGHIASILLTNSRKVEFPAVALLVSGGHTELILVKNWNDYRIIGQTRDDAAGEAFDKVARLLDLPYPGGPEISRLAKLNPGSNTKIEPLPRPMLNSSTLDFSFSGLKTAVMYLVKDTQTLEENFKIALADEFQQAVLEVLIKKTELALTKTGARSIITGGGVLANKELRQSLEQLTGKYDLPVFIPELKLTTDNAEMIAAAGYLNYLTDQGMPHHDLELIPNGQLSFAKLDP